MKYLMAPMWFSSFLEKESVSLTSLLMRWRRARVEAPEVVGVLFLPGVQVLALGDDGFVALPVVGVEQAVAAHGLGHLLPQQAGESAGCGRRPGRR